MAKSDDKLILAIGSSHYVTYRPIKPYPRGRSLRFVAETAWPNDEADRDRFIESPFPLKIQLGMVEGFEFRKRLEVLECFDQFEELAECVLEIGDQFTSEEKSLALEMRHWLKVADRKIVSAHDFSREFAKLDGLQRELLLKDLGPLVEMGKGYIAKQSKARRSGFKIHEDNPYWLKAARGLLERNPQKKMRSIAKYIHDNRIPPPSNSSEQVRSYLRRHWRNPAK